MLGDQISELKSKLGIYCHMCIGCDVSGEGKWFLEFDYVNMATLTTTDWHK